MTRRLLVDGRLLDGSRVDIVVSEGVVVASAPRLGVEPDDDVVDLRGGLVLPAMVEPHAHLDKALTADRVPNLTGDLNGAIEAWIAAAGRGEFGVDEMTERAFRALEKLAFSGVTLVRTHVNVGVGDPEFVNLRAVRAAADQMAGLVDVQLVALMHSPLAGDDGRENRRLLSGALEIGVDLVGGCPHLEPDGVGMIDTVIAAANEAGIGLDLHVDETLDASVSTLSDLARRVRDSGFDGRVNASHCVSLSVQPIETQLRVAREVAEADVSIVTLPQTNLFLQGWGHDVAMPRGITPIDVLREAGVVVAAGADNVQDPFNPVGRSDPLETAALLVMAAHQIPDNAFEMVSDDARRVLGEARAGVAIGDRADLVVVEATTLREVLADAPATRRVFRRGVEVAVTTTTRRLVRPSADRD